MAFFDGIPDRSNGEDIEAGWFNIIKTFLNNFVTTFVLNDITDVEAPTPSDGEALVYDNGTGDWVNGIPSMATDDLTDVNTSAAAPTDGQLLTYVNANSRWENKDQVKLPLSTVSVATNYTATLTDEVILVTKGGISRTISLPEASTASGKEYTITVLDSSAGRVIIETFNSGSEAIDDNLWSGKYYVIDRGESATLYCDGTQWYVKSTVFRQVVNAQSALKVHPGTNYVWLNMTSNSLGLNEGIYRLTAYLACGNQGSAPNFNFVELAWTTTNGTDTAASPTFITPFAGSARQYNISGSVASSHSDNQAGLSAAPVMYQVGVGGQTVYAVPRLAAVTPAQINAQVTIFAERIY